MRLTKFNPETGQYEYKEPAKTQGEFAAQRKAAIQRLGEYEDNILPVACTRQIAKDLGYGEDEFKAYIKENIAVQLGKYLLESGFIHFTENTDKDATCVIGLIQVLDRRDRPIDSSYEPMENLLLARHPFVDCTKCPLRKEGCHKNCKFIKAYKRRINNEQR